VLEKATFAAGPFWGVEVAFRNVDGVVDVKTGYTGGTTLKPTYSEVCAGETGHAQAVQLLFDTQLARYADLLDVFWELHDPTQLNRQGMEVGTPYRSAIFVHSPEQERAAIASREQVREHYSAPVVTQIVAVGRFHVAESYHQRYLEKRGLAACKV
jgi:peptide-methionine (S)-S-oxide reductase